MERDMDFTRSILFAIEKSKPGKDYTDYLPGFDEGQEPSEELDDKRKYHMLLLRDAGYVKGVDLKASFGENFADILNPQLTWQGQEFLEAIRENTTYEKAKSTVKEKTGALSFEFVKEVAIQLGKRALLGE